MCLDPVFAPPHCCMASHCTDIQLFTDLLLNGCLDSFQFRATVNKDAVGVPRQVSSSAATSSRMGEMLEGLGRKMLSYLLQCGCAILSSHRQYARVLVAPPLLNLDRL